MTTLSLFVRVTETLGHARTPNSNAATYDVAAVVDFVADVHLHSWRV